MLGFNALGRLALGEADAGSATILTANAGTFTLSLQSVAGALSLAADVGAFTISGQTASYSSSMPAAAGSFSFTGQTSAVVASFVLSASPYVLPTTSFIGFASLGQVSLGGSDTRATEITFNLSFQDVASNRTLYAQAGSYTITSQQVRLFEGYTIDALPGAFLISGSDVSFNLSMPAPSGSFLISAKTIDLTRRIGKIRAFPRVGNPTFSARATGRDGFRVRAHGG